MKVNTHLAKALDAAREKSAYDKQIVKILSNQHKEIQNFKIAITMILRKCIPYGFARMCQSTRKIL